MNSELLNELIAVNLRYSAVAKPLRTRAIAQVVAKVLYTAPTEQGVNTKILAQDVGSVCEINEVSQRNITDALDMLKNLGFAEKVKRGWTLTEKGRKTIEEDLNRSRALISSIIDRHFPQAISEKRLRDWLCDVCTAYFGLYSIYWVASVCGTPPKVIPTPSAWQNIVPKIASKHSMEQYIDVLTKGFGSFLDSNDPRDQEYMWCLGQAMFAAKLIASGIGVDPITTNEIKDTIVFLDTNILLMSALEGHEHASSIETLGLALKTLNIRLTYLPITGSEYSRVVSLAREETLRVVSRYPKSVIDKASDPFARTARVRGCNSIEDYERFFDEIMEVPTGIDTEPITLCEDKEILLSAESGEGDNDVKEQVTDAWKLMRRPYRKPANAVIHDAALMCAIEEARARGHRCWVLTADKTMSWLSAQRSGKSGKISWIAVDTLIHVLALDLTGPSYKVEGFGPLMSAVLKNEVQPMLGTYETRDLAWLLDIEERCADLTEEQTEKCAAIVTQARLSGKRVDDPELQLDVQRAFQGERLELVTDISVAKADNMALRAELESERSTSKDLQDALVKERASRYCRQAWKTFAWKTGLAVLFGGASIAAGILLAFSSESNDTVFFRIGLPALLFMLGITTILSTLKRQVGRLRESLRSATDIAKREIVGPGTT